MVSSLAHQLSKGVSVNAPLLADRSHRKRAQSYLFTSREADQHDFHSVHALGVNGLSKLKTLSARFAKYEDTLFSDTARGLDRTLQSESQNTELNRTLGSFLRELGPFLLETPASKALEWLVRRFRVNEFNVDDVMALFLPYHESPHFAKMVSILRVKDSGLWSFLSPLQAAGKPLPRSLLVQEMLSNIDLARFATSLLPESLSACRTYRTLVGFTASVMVEYMTRMKRIEVEVVTFILPTATRCFSPSSNADCAMAGYISLATLSQRCRLSASALETVMVEMIKGQRHVKSNQILPLVVAVVGPQDQLEEFSDLVTDSIIQVPGIMAAIPDCLQWVGSEKLFLPMLPSLIRRADHPVSSAALNTLILVPNVPKMIIERLVVLLMGTIPRLSDGSELTGLRLLSMIYQRYGELFSVTTVNLLRAVEEEEDRRIFEALLRSVALPSSMSTSDDHSEWILSSGSADVSSRVIAVRELLKTMATRDIDLELEKHKDLHDALRARVLDTSATVIETLYSDPKVILPIMSNMQFIDSVSKALAAPDVSRAVMRLHLAFIAAEFCAHNPNLVSSVFERVYLPYLLFTKPRQKTAALVWQSLKNSKLANYELLAGCMDLVFANPAAEGSSRSVEEMATLNLAVTSMIAGNTIASNTYPRHLDLLLGFLSGPDAHVTIISYLILRSLLGQLSGEHRVEAAHRMLVSMKIGSLDELHGVVTNAATLQDVISEETLSKNVVLKPSSIGTTHRLQAGVLALLPVIQQPIDVKIDWLGDGDSESSDLRGKRFVEFARAMYSLANSSSTTQVLATSLLRALFVNLREHALLFLAGIWSTALDSDTVGHNLPLTALFHGAAFLKAQTADTEHLVDFQVILPSILIAIQSAQRPVRSAAMDCVALIAQSSSSATSSPTIYALDSIYGKGSDGLQYLEWSDFGRYVAALHSRREHFINDAGYLGIFQQEMLRKERRDSRKEAGYKHRIICYMLSHAVVWSSLEARVALLGALKDVQQGAKLQMLLPLIQNLISYRAACPPMGNETKWPMYCQLLLEAFDETATPALNEAGSGSWITFVKALRFAFADGAPSFVRQTISNQLRGGLFDLLTTDHQRETGIVLVESAAVYPDSQSIIKETLGVLLKDTALMTSLLNHFQPAGMDSSQRASKRAKLVPEPDISSTGLSLRPMTALVEIFMTHPLPASAELMSSAVDALTRVFHTHPTQSDANYLMQLLMSMLESIASSMTGTTTLLPGSLRMEILVELLRVADNPQTFNQALLLIASLARLAPEFVMQNVMPVFTFMGSNVFHRDDSYSFRVVQKTVESVVPVVVNSLRTKHDGLDLQIASREFLRVFTDAATHVPRHRRSQFFNHLVGVLGPDEFTVSVCLLLIDKVANRVVRQKSGDVANALNLPLIILQANYKATPFKVVEQLLHECRRLLFRITDPDSTAHPAFLEQLQDGDQTLSTSTKRQIQAILLFVDLVLQHSSREGTATDEIAAQESVRLLLVLSNLDQGVASPEFPELSRVAFKALSRLLRIISATEFASAIVTIIGSSNPAVESGAMNLLASRLSNVAPKARQDISPTIASIIKHAGDRLKDSQDLVILQAALKALCAVAQTAVDKEMSILATTVPLVLQTGAERKNLTADVLSCILPLSVKLGPRILPVFRDIVEFCGSVLVQAETTAAEQSRDEEVAQSIIVALLSNLSQFWGTDELARLAGLSLGNRPTLLTLRKTLAKQALVKQLLPALFRVWSELDVVNDEQWSRREAFFDLFKRVTRDAPREDVHEHLRQMFNIILDAFDIIGRDKNENENALENTIVSAFVQVVNKLNEAAFKPWFRRLFDWAFNHNAGNLPYRQIAFCRVMTALIKSLKGLLTPYMGTVLVPLTEALESFRANLKQPRLWLSLVELLQISLAFDDGGFWRTDKLRKLMPTLVAQIEVCPSLKDGNSRQALKICLSTLVTTTDDDSLLKGLNLAVLLQTRSDDAQVRIFALECAGYLWDMNGEKLMGFVSDCAVFIAESSDDEHDEVAKEARRLKKTIESRCGSLDVLMQ